MSERILTVHIDTAGFEKLAARFRSVGKNIKPALSRAINHTGDKARTEVARALVEQTGAKYSAVRKVLKTHRASAATLDYRITATGGFMSLKEFGARQTGKGVSAAPWGKRRVFRHAFIVASLGGHVFRRAPGGGPSGLVGRLPILKLWGPAIPKEMVKEQSKEAFENTVRAELPRRVEYEINAILRGSVPSR